MERGLLWLPLLGVFIWLAWAGWNEYQKVEAYRRWSSDFERHKYDIYAILGQSGDRLVWCKPARQQPIELGSIGFGEIEAVRLNVNGKPIESLADASEAIATAKKIATVSIELVTTAQLAAQSSAQLAQESVQSIRFTDAEIALNWFRYLSAQVGSAIV
jgi:allophanate hydrolase subunit 2